MTVDELQQFIENNIYADVPTDKYNELMNAAESMDLRSFADKYSDFMSNNSEGWVDFSKKFPKSLSERIRNEFGSSDNKNPFSSKSQKEIDEIYNTYFSDDVPREKFDNYLTNMSNYWNDEKNARDYEAGKFKRKQEIKDWGWRNLLASDYEKQRYINEPEKAIFGKEAPDLGDAPETRDEALADVGLGAIALAGDVGTSFLKMNPITFGAAVATGPVIRGTRDILHKMTNSPYQKEWEDIGIDVLKDMKSNAEIEGLANLRQLSRIVKGVSNGPISTALKNEESISNLKKQLDAFPAISELNDIPRSELYDMIDKLPADSPFKQALKPYADNMYNVDRVGIADEIARHHDMVEVFENPELAKKIKDVADFGDLTNHLQQLSPKLRKEISEITEMGDKIPFETLVNDKEILTKLQQIPDIKTRLAVASALSQNNLGKMMKFGERQLEKDILSNPSLTRAQLIGKNALKIAEGIPSKSGGALKAVAVGALKAVAVGARKESLSEPERLERDWYLENYTRDWDMGFKPAMKEGDPKWEAYREYYINKYGTDPEDE